MGLLLPCVLMLLLVLGLEKRVGESHGLGRAETSSSVSPAEREGSGRRIGTKQCLHGAGWSPPCLAERSATRLAQGGWSTSRAPRAKFSNGQRDNSLQLWSADTAWPSFIGLFLVIGAALVFICIACRIVLCLRNQLRLQRPVQILNEQLELGQLELPNPTAAATATTTATATTATAAAPTSMPSMAMDSTQEQSRGGDRQ